MPERTDDVAWQRRRMLRKWDERGGPSRLQRWSHDNRATATALMVLLTGGVAAAVWFGMVAGVDDPRPRSYTLLILLPIVPAATYVGIGRSRRWAAEWDQAQVRGEDITPDYHPDEGVVRRNLSPGARRHFAVRFGLLAVVLVIVLITAITRGTSG